MRMAAGLVLGLGMAGVAAAQSGAPWAYTGNTRPANWGKLDPSYKACSDGKQQSPIDIRGARLNKALQPIEFHYIAGGVTVENTGNLVQVLVHPVSYMVADGVRYELQRLEFHHPSEHAVRGKLTDMDVELVHKSADGKMAIVSVRMMMDRGVPNAMLAAVWMHMPRQAGGREEVTSYVNPGGFLPGDRGYWTYTGSTTTPPCTEGAKWFVMEQTLSVSREQLRQYADLIRVSSRPLQDANGRRIEANE